MSEEVAAMKLYPRVDAAMEAMARLRSGPLDDDTADVEVGALLMAAAKTIFLSHGFRAVDIPDHVLMGIGAAGQSAMTKYVTENIKVSTSGSVVQKRINETT